MSLANVRNLHWVFKIGDRTATSSFLHGVLSMKALRHEEVRLVRVSGCADAISFLWRFVNNLLESASRSACLYINPYYQ
jgi:hypothetical protein